MKSTYLLIILLGKNKNSYKKLINGYTLLWKLSNEMTVAFQMPVQI